jgi:NAD(P)-dependent dehydrogenase (short-subunit alcohol dehydrogenase family)
MNKTILITGGTGKVGSQLVKHFYTLGWNVLFTAFQQEEADLIQTQLYNKNMTNKITGMAVDLEQENIGNNLRKFVESEKLYPNCLVNCARSLNYLKISPSGQTMRPEWMGEFKLNVVIAYELAIALANQDNSILESIINISSMYGVVPANPNLYKNPTLESPIQYGVTKAALIHLTKELAIRFANKKIKVNAISFGGIEGRVDDEFKKRYAQLCPFERMLQDNEVVGAVEFLATNQSTFITGHNLVVDGGWSVW